ncbi:MAG: MmgE/PrpD family protein [Alphaproteobacteria bacterium]|nr:MmgE/PrpD family protein [Alphaproteobacteria bacterium]
MTTATKTKAAALSGQISRTLGDFAHGLTYDDIPADIRERAKYLILDSVGIAMASTQHEFANCILAGIQAIAEPGDCPVIGMKARLGMRDAVLMNGALVHGLDYDDTHMKSVVHATAATLPTAMVVAAREGASGKDVLTAYIVGMEVAIRIGEAANFGFHHRGYHATGVVAHFASALIAGKLLGLDAAQLATAQGVVCSTAMASQEFVEDGAWNKRLHPGWGGVAGIMAAGQAKHGYIAPGKPYEGRFGIFKNHLADLESHVDYAAITDQLGDRWAVVESAIKPYPTCHFTHAIADSALALRERHGIEATNIARIRALIPEDTVPVIAEPVANKKRPSSDYDAKFSTQFIAAACFERGKFGLAELEDEALSDPAILALADKVDCEIDPNSEFPRFFSGGMVVTTKDGGEFIHHERINRGAGDRALTGEEIVSKFTDNAMMASSRERAEAVQSLVLSLDDSDAQSLAEGLTAQ